MTAKAAAERAAIIRRQNVQRHTAAAANSLLRFQQQRHAENRNMQNELNSLHGASLRHNGLDIVGYRRMNEVKQRVIIK